MTTLAASLVAVALLAAAPPAQGSECVACHAKVTPGIVVDWKLSRHAAVSVGCEGCHGSLHASSEDAARARLPTPDTCAECHAEQVAQFKRGKHSLAWAAMKAMPTVHYQPALLTDGLKGCGGCHAIGLKAEADVKDIERATGGQFGAASCDACHTRHTFSVREAREPQACKTCHMGFDHAQWEMYDSSKHGVRHELKRLGVLAGDASAPTCQTCHYQGGNHEVGTAWGFLAVRLPLPDDKQWQADQLTILKALGVLNPAGQPTSLLEVVKAAKVARLTQDEWQSQRDRMLATCEKCHSRAFATSQLRRGDQSIQEADRLMADAIETVAGLYRDGILRRSREQAFDYPNVLQFHDSPSVVEQRLFVMFLEHRMRTFQGTFHNSPDYALWYGWSEMQRDLAEIKALAGELRRARAIDAKLGLAAPAKPAKAARPAAPAPR